MKNSKVLVIGDAFIDLSTEITDPPQKGGCVWGTSLHISQGGSAANISYALARLQIPNSFLGVVGNDLYGKLIIEVMEKEKIDVSTIQVTDQAPTGTVVVMIDKDGERTFVPAAWNAAHSLLSLEHLKKVQFTSYQAVMISGVCLIENPARETLIEALKSASSKGIRTYYDPNLRLDSKFSFKEYFDAQLKAIKLADVILIGDNELRQLFNVKSDTEGIENIAAFSHKKVIVVKRGELGALGYVDNNYYEVPAFKVKVKNTTGAGDAFDAGFICAQLRGLSIKESIRYANAVAAIKVTLSGSVFEASYHDVDNLLNS